jgi:hypothetical protein
MLTLRRGWGRPKSALEEGEVDGVCHGLIAEVVRVQVVTAVEGGQQPQGVGRVPDRLVEVDDAIEGAAGTDPVVDGLAFGFSGGGVVPGALERRQRGAEDLQARGVAGLDFRGANYVINPFALCCTWPGLVT